MIAALLLNYSCLTEAATCLSSPFTYGMGLLHLGHEGLPYGSRSPTRPSRPVMDLGIV